MPAFKDKDRGTWFAKFYYTDWTGSKRIKKKRGFKTKREALAFERNFLEQKSDSPDILFSNFIEKYLKDISNRIRPTSMENKQKILDIHILPHFKNCIITEITANAIREWQNLLLSKDYSPAYIRSIHAQLSAIFNYAMKYYNLPTNPCRLAGVVGSSKSAEMSIWTLEEFKKFTSILPTPVHKLMFDILFWTGMRNGELLALTKQDVKENRIIVCKSFSVIKKKIVITPPKTKKGNREILLPNFLLEDLNKYIKSFYGLKKSDRIFPFTRAKLYRIIHRYAIKAGLKEIRTHDLRHSHASFLIEQGCNPLLIAERLGHENVETTLNTYSHLYPNKQEELIKKFDELNDTSKRKQITIEVTEQQEKEILLLLKLKKAS